jgi:hypothetical protein
VLLGERRLGLMLRMGLALPEFHQLAFCRIPILSFACFGIGARRHVISPFYSNQIQKDQAAICANQRESKFKFASLVLIRG